MGRIKAVLLIFFVSLTAYSNSLGGDFVYDDSYFVVKNVSIRNLKNIPSFFVNPAAVAFAELSKDVYRPVTTSSYALDYFLWKLNTFGYHLVNVLVHSSNAALVFLFLYAVFENISLALFASLFFACHPVQTEVVSWISGRASVLFLFFYMAALLFYVKFLKGAGKRYLIASLSIYALSLYSKEMAVTLPLILIAYDTHFFPKDALRKKVLRYLPYLGLTLFFLITRTFVLKRVGQCGWWGGSPYHTFLTMAWVMTEYIKLLFFPVRLCAFYVLDVARSIAQTKVLASMTLLAALSVWLPYLFKRSRRSSFAVWWFFITILPVSNIVPLRALMAERFLYLPSIGFCLLIAIFIDRLKAVLPRAGSVLASAAAIVLILSYSARTITRNDDWKDSVTITEAIIRLHPLNPWALASLATAYLEEKRYDEAVKAARKGIAVSGHYAPPWHALGFCYLEMGRYEDAAKTLEKALALEPRNMETMNSLGVAYGNMKRYDEAIRLFKESIAIDPTFVSAYLNLGTTYEFTHEHEKAIAEYRKIAANARSVQDIALSYVRLGDVYVKLKDREKARAYYERAVLTCGSGFDELKKVARERLATNWVEK